MKVCPTCGTAFDGPETFCPHDGARLFEAKNKAGQWTGKILANKVKLERHLFADELGERYVGARLDGGGKVRVTLFNMGFEPTQDRVAALRGVRALLESPLPAQLTEVLELELDAEVPYLIESDPQGASMRLLLNEREHFDRPTAMRITCSVARVIEWLDQSAGISHRALHPQAIYVTHIGKGEVCVAEWAHGILAYKPKPLEAAQQQQPVPYSEYMAPELTDDASRADRRSALYTLGMLLYEMLVGVPSHTAPTVEEVLKRHRRERPAKLSIMSKDPAVGTTLDEIFELITGKDPEARFQAPMALINAMSTLLQSDGDDQFPELVRAKSAPSEIKAVKEAGEPDESKSNGKSSTAKNGAKVEAAQEVEEVEDARRSTMLFIAPSELTQSNEALMDTNGGSSKKRRRRKQADDSKETASPEVKAESVTQSDAVEEGVRPTEQMDLSEVLAEDRKRQNLKVEVEDPEPESKAQAEPSSKIVVDEEALKPSSAVSGQSETQTDPKGLEESSSSAEDTDDQAETTPMTTKKKRRRKKGSSSKSAPVEAKPTAAEPKKEEKIEVKPEPKEKVEAKVEPAPSKEQPAAKTDEPKDEPASKRRKSSSEQATPAESPKAVESKAKPSEPAKTSLKKEEPLEPPKATAAASTKASSSDEALPDTWFTTSTEPAWDQSYLEEHSDLTEKKFRKILMFVMVIFVLTCLAFLLYVVFGPENVKDEEARLLIHEATRQVLALHR